VAYPVLDRDFVEHVLKRLADEGAEGLPSPKAASNAFTVLGNRPEELIRALRLLRAQLPPGADPDTYLPVIAATLRSSAASAELLRLDQLGGLDHASRVDVWIS
jgi:hypothetical protein